ncbi:UrcA family protein [Altererythrobacter aurantiacus]|uniref:UrcA family protein n=1 Tax=Parapontixanthobacter aurantiacus TaxID=1463599 RepID=A0A844ZMJ5_9SPHN|nr:UrcA family protein [Parapontixanthobacter aurantiacus]MXO86879.1 UrcA family protein [Parapontixanthobacter aurantiacus]
MKTAFTLFAAASALAVAMPASAQMVEQAQIEVEYTDLNLASQKGQDRLERRLKKAAREVCGLDQQRTGSRIVDQKTQACYKMAMATAMERHAALVADHRLGG